MKKELNLIETMNESIKNLYILKKEYEIKKDEEKLNEIKICIINLQKFIDYAMLKQNSID